MIPGYILLTFISIVWAIRNQIYLGHLLNKCQVLLSFLLTPDNQLQKKIYGYLLKQESKAISPIPEFRMYRTIVYHQRRLN